MLIPILIAVLAQESGQEARIPTSSTAHPRIFESKDGRWALDVKPGSGLGGRTAYSLFFQGAQVWARQHPFLLTDVLLLDDGTAFGHGFRPLPPGLCYLGYEIWRDNTYRIGAVFPDGQAERLGSMRNRHEPRRLVGSLEEGEYVFALSARGGISEEFTRSRVDTAPLPTSPGSDLDELRLRRTPITSNETARVELELVGVAQLTEGRHAISFVDARGRVVVADRGGHWVKLYDRDGRVLEEHDQRAASYVKSVTVDHRGRVLLLTRAGLELADGSTPEGFRVRSGAHELIAASQSSSALWAVDFGRVRRIDEAGPILRRAPTEHWLVAPWHGAAVSPNGTLVVLDSRDSETGELRLLHSYEADGSPLRSVVIPAGNFHLFADDQDALVVDGNTRELWLHALDGTYSIRCSGAPYGRPAFSPDGKEIWLVGTEAESDRLALYRYNRPGR